jgi:uncharacterized protein
MNKIWANDLKKGLWAITALIAVAYLSLCGYLYVNQNKLIYKATRADISPQVAGVPIEDLRLRTPDGESLQAWYSPPKPGMPVILFLPGQGQHLNDAGLRYKIMHDRGVGFLSVAYRGFSGSTGTPSEAGVYTDALTGYDYLGKLGFKPEDIVVHGHSLGTGIATFVASQRPMRALILEAPFAAAADVAQSRYPLIPVSLLMHDKFESRERMEQISTRVMIAHGDADATIPISEGQKLYARTRPPKIFILIKGGGHSDLPKRGVYKAYWQFIGLDKKRVE